MEGQRPDAPGAITAGLPLTIAPMLPAAGGEPFDSPAHLFEVMWSGVRAIAFVEGGRVRVQDRFCRDVTQRYPELQEISPQLNGSGIVLDGEIVALDARGRPDFALLRPRLASDDPGEAKRLATRTPVTFQAFDILYQDGRRLMSEPLRRRKSVLRQCARLPGPLAVPDFVEREGIAFFEAVRQHGLEGIVAKERESRYLPGQRSRAWEKLRVYEKDEFVICGFTYGGPIKGRLGPRSRRPLVSLLLGLYDEGGRLRYVGEVEGGFADASLDETVRILDDVASRVCPLDPPPALARLVFWCRPCLAASVRYAGWTREGNLRFPLFESLRPDVPAESCRLEGRGR